MTALLAAMLGVLYLIFVSLFLRRDNHKITFSVYNLFVFLMGFIYGLLFPLSYILTKNGMNADSFIKIYSTIGALDIIAYYAVVTIISSVILIVFRGKKDRHNIEGLLMHEEGGKDNYNLFAIALFMFIIGVIANYLYLRAYGGYSNYLNYASFLRSGITITDNPFSFLAPIRNCVVFSSYLFFSKIADKKHKVPCAIMFFLSFVFSMMVLYSNFGRSAFLIYFLILIVYLVLSRRNIRYMDFKFIAGVALLLLVFSGALTIIGDILSRNSGINLISQINKEVSFVFADFFIMKNNISIENYRFFLDLILFPVFLLPSSIWSVKFGIIAASDLMTFFTMGGFKGDANIYGEMPVDLITISFMQAGFIGTMVLPFCYAKIFSKVCRFINRLGNSNGKIMIASYALITFGVESFFYADPKHIVSASVPFIIFFTIVKIISAFRKPDEAFDSGGEANR